MFYEGSVGTYNLKIISQKHITNVQIYMYKETTNEIYVPTQSAQSVSNTSIHIYSAPHINIPSPNVQRSFYEFPSAFLPTC